MTSKPKINLKHLINIEIDNSSIINLKKDIFLISHTPVDKEIQNLCKYCNKSFNHKSK